MNLVKQITERFYILKTGISNPNTTKLIILKLGDLVFCTLTKMHNQSCFLLKAQFTAITKKLV